MGGRKYFLNNGVGMSDKPLPYKHIQDLTHKQLLQVMIDKLCCVSGSSLLLDIYSGAAAAYSVRKLRSGYTGSAIRVRRLSDNTEQDIGFVGGELDTASLTTFCSGTDGFVTTWYDQSGNAYNATQTSATSQPQIVSSGSVLLENGKAAINFLNTKEFGITVPNSFFGLNDISAFLVTRTILNDNGGLSQKRDGFLAGNFGIGVVSGKYQFQTRNGAISSTVESINAYSTQQILSVVRNSSGLYMNSPETKFTSSAVADLTSSAQWQFGNGNSYGILNGNIQEKIIYLSDQTSNQSAIQTNINKAFNIYWDGTQKGLLDTYTGAEAAYSLRALNSAYTGAILRVRRDSDNAEQDIYAKWDGTLNVEALESFCSATDGYVTTWYDQSGNGNNATQATAASQPKIVSSGSVITVNGYQVIQYDGSNDNLGTSLTATGTMLMGGSDGTAFYEVSISGAYNLLASAANTDHPLNETLRIIWDRSLSAGEKSAIESLVTYSDWDFSDVTTFFQYWRLRTELPSFPLLDVSSGTNFAAAWRNCSSLTSFPLLDVSSGTTFTAAWNSCSSLTSFPLLDVGSGTNFSSAWYSCSSLTSFPLLDVSSGANFQNTWYNCSSLTSFPLLDVSSGTNFQYTWQSCNSLTSFPLLDVSSGTNFFQAWRLCTSLTSFPLLDVSSGTNFQEAWRNCSSLTSFPLLDVSSGTTFQEAWFNCTSLTSFPLLDVSSGTTFQGAWRGCSSLTSFPANMFDSVTATDFTNAFASTNLTQTSIDNILVSLDTAGQSNGTFNQSGGSAPSATGEAAIDNLRSRGWAVTVTGGY